MVPACLCSSRLCALGESCSRADSGESLVTAAVKTVPSQFLPCSAVTGAFHQKQSWWPASAAALLRDPCPSRLLLGMSSGACCADVTATPSRVPGDVAEAPFLGKARACTKLISPRALDFLSALFSRDGSWRKRDARSRRPEGAEQEGHVLTTSSRGERLRSGRPCDPEKQCGEGARSKSGLLNMFVGSGLCAASFGWPRPAVPAPGLPSAIPFCLHRAFPSLQRQPASHFYSSCDLLDGSCLLWL